MNEEYQSLANHFLIAMPSMADPNFSQTVTYICQHNEEGALGVVINRPSGMSLKDVFEQMEIEPASNKFVDYPVCLGGPVQEERGFIIHKAGEGWKSTLPVTESISLTTSRDLLDSMAKGEGGDEVLVALGYAGWGAGQLEEEMLANAWLSVPSNEAILFKLPFEKRWKAAAEALGIDLSLLTIDAGHG